MAAQAYAVWWQSLSKRRLGEALHLTNQALTQTDLHGQARAQGSGLSASTRAQN